MPFPGTEEEGKTERVRDWEKKFLSYVFRSQMTVRSLHSECFDGIKSGTLMMMFLTVLQATNARNEAISEMCLVLIPSTRTQSEKSKRKEG